VIAGVGQDLRLLLPELLLTAWAFGLLGLGMSRALRHWTTPAGLVGCVVTGLVLWGLTAQASGDGVILGGMLAWDPVTRFFKWFSLGVLVFVLLLARGDRGVQEEERGEYLCLLTLVVVGMMLLAAAHHFVLVILAMELISMLSYLLVAFPRHDPRASEAALKYFLFGAFTSGILLYGISLLYAATHTLDLGALRQAMEAATGGQLTLVILGVTLVLVGIGFKISMVPLHLWTPDAYEGAPIPVAALLSVGPKAAGFALLVRFLTASVGSHQPVWLPLVGGLAVLTMTFGNLVALAQTNMKRLLAYSTIAQVGYLLIGVVAADRLGYASVWFYLVAYLLMNCGAFAVVSVMTTVTGQETLEAYRGLAQRAPGLAALFAIFLLSLAGIPPLAGFLGKFFLFGAALSAQLSWLAVAGIINSVIALYYYVNIIRLMYLQVPVEQTPIAWPWSLRAATALAAVGTLILGLAPSRLLHAISRSLPAL